MGSGRVDSGGGRKGRPDNNVTIRLPPNPPTGPAEPWRRVKVNNSHSLKGSVGGEKGLGWGVVGSQIVNLDWCSKGAETDVLMTVGM